MLAVIARIEISPNHIDQYIAAATAGIDATRAEPGCQQYAFSRDLLQPNVLWVSEQWESEAALQTHLRTPHVQKLLADTADLEIISMDDRVYECDMYGRVTMPQ